MDLSALIEKLSAATEGSLELNAHCKMAKDGGVRLVLHYAAGTCFEAFRADGEQLWVLAEDQIPAYTTSLDAALSLVPEHISYELTFSAAGEGAMRRARMWDWRRGPMALDRTNNWEATAATLPLCVCIAALRAREAAHV